MSNDDEIIRRIHAENPMSFDHAEQRLKEIAGGSYLPAIGTIRAAQAALVEIDKLKKEVAMFRYIADLAIDTLNSIRGYPTSYAEASKPS